MKVYLRTFGCRANHYDTEAVRAMLEANGHAIVSSPADADVAVFNSCAVTSEAEAELRKVGAPERRANAPGCGVSSWAAPRRSTMSAPTRCAFARCRPLNTSSPAPILSAIADALESRAGRDAAFSRRAQTGTRALLRVQDGCDEHCTFCATTLARGANRSRPADDLAARRRASPSDTRRS